MRRTFSPPAIATALAAVLAAGTAGAADPVRTPAPARSEGTESAPTVSLVGDTPQTSAASRPGGAPSAAPAPSAMTPTVARPAMATTGPGRTPAPTSPGAAPRTAAAAAALRGPPGEAAPRPATDVRVQSRFAVKAKNTQLFGAAEYLSRGDFFNSPGVRAGATYYPIEALGVELQVSHYWSTLNDEAERVKRELGALPDSHAPGWLFLAGGRYSIGYGKLMVGGMGGAIHFEPQAFIHAGVHVHDGDVGPSSDVGLGLLVFLTPKLFTRFDAAIVYERETRSGSTVSVWGTLPSIAVGGAL